MTETAAAGAAGLRGWRVVVAGGAVDPGWAIAAGLADAGASVAVIGPDGAEAARVAELLALGAGAALGRTCSLDDRDGVALAIDEAVTALGGLDMVVHARIDPDGLVPLDVVDMDVDTWERLAEAPVREALWVVQGSHRHLGGGGRIVLVCPSVSLEGAAGLVALAGAAEAQRMLAKGAARRWGPEGITVNVVAPSVADLAPSLAGTDAARTPAARPAQEGLRPLVDAVVLFSSPAAAGLTGATIGADRGALMAP